MTLNRLIPLLLFTSIGSPVTAVGQHSDSSADMSAVFAARAQLVGLLGSVRFLKSVRDVEIGRTRITYTADLDYTGANYSDQSIVGMSGSIVFPNGKLSAEEENGNYYVEVDRKTIRVDGTLKGRRIGISFKSESDATKFVAALLILRDAAHREDTEAADFEAFRLAAGPTQGTPRAAMSDEARTFRLVAEDALSRKDVFLALNAYTKALNVDAMWADGQYNAAVLSAQTGDYELAARHMRRYLVLAPDAKDAAAARDKLLLWQYKASEEGTQK